jgi:hypothetical protein
LLLPPFSCFDAGEAFHQRMQQGQATMQQA